MINIKEFKKKTIRLCFVLLKKGKNEAFGCVLLILHSDTDVFEEQCKALLAVLALISSVLAVLALT